VKPVSQTAPDRLTPAPQRAATLLDRARDTLNARMTKDNLLLVLENVINYAADLEAQRERRRVRLVALQNDALSIRGVLSPAGEDRKVPFPLGETLTPAVEWLVNRVAELEKELTTARTEAIADVGDWLDEHGQKDAAYLVYTVDIPAARNMRVVRQGGVR
jgi:hypothetical protein